MSEVKLVGSNWVILKQKAKSRKGIMRLLGSLRGSAAARVNFISSFMDAKDFPQYLSRRLSHSVRLARFAEYYLYLFRTKQYFLVGGAHAQEGSGVAGGQRRDAMGRLVYSSWEAAHVRYGTFYVGSDAVYEAWHKRLLGLLQAKHLPAGDLPALFPVNSELIQIIAAYEAATDQTDTMMNRVFGMMETKLHPFMTNMIYSDVGSNPEALREKMRRLTENMPRFISKLLFKVARDRLAVLASEPKKELRQDPTGPHAFDGEIALLQALMAQVDDTSSAMWQSVKQALSQSGSTIADEVNDVSLAAQELAALA